MDLDAQYGDCRRFARTASDAELSVMPRSLQLLDKNTAPSLKNYFDSAKELLLTQVIHQTTPILWLVDELGAVRFALEEVVNRDTGHLHYVLPRNGPSLRPNEIRLGHPALLDPVLSGQTKAARIAGEIIYDPVPQSPHPWVITNNSGRFGKRPHLSRAHLENVKNLFASYEIALRSFFIYTPEELGVSL